MFPHGTGASSGSRPSGDCSCEWARVPLRPCSGSVTVRERVVPRCRPVPKYPLPVLRLSPPMTGRRVQNIFDKYTGVAGSTNQKNEQVIRANLQPALTASVWPFGRVPVPSSRSRRRKQHTGDFRRAECRPTSHVHTLHFCTASAPERSGAFPISSTMCTVIAISDFLTRGDGSSSWTARSSRQTAGSLAR
jgi:hypothetical protein